MKMSLDMGVSFSCTVKLTIWPGKVSQVILQNKADSKVSVCLGNLLQSSQVTGEEICSGCNVTAKTQLCRQQFYYESRTPLPSVQCWVYYHTAYWPTKLEERQRKMGGVGGGEGRAK